MDRQGPVQPALVGPLDCAPKRRRPRAASRSADHGWNGEIRGRLDREDGKVKHGVKNMRFNDSCLGMLQRTVGIGKPGSCADVELMPSLFPALVVEDWNFVSTTDF